MSLRTVSLLLGSLVTAGLACTLHAGGPEAPGPPIPVSSEAVEDLESEWALAFLESGEVVLSINETQLTSLLALRLEAGENPVLQQPRVYLRDGEIRIFGVTKQGILSANVLVVLSPLIDSEGNLSLDLVSVDVGPVPAPDAVREGVSAVLTEAFAGTVGPFITGINVSAVSVSDGLMVIIGSFR